MPPVAFPAIVGQDAMKLALILVVVNPSIGGVVIRGERGTGKSTAIRALRGLLPDRTAVRGCRYGCNPRDPAAWCDNCRDRSRSGPLPEATERMRVVELPLNASEDRVVGALDVEAAMRHGHRRFEPGILARANGNLLYIDEVNLLEDHIVDVLLDAAAMGRNTVERDGISVSHPARCLLVGTMNPEEGDLRPQLLDRFGLCVDVAGLRGLEDRVRVMEADAAAGDRPAVEAGDLRHAIEAARTALPRVTVPVPVRHLISVLCVGAGASGHRADITITGAARAHRAWRWARGAEPGVTAPAELTVTVDDVLAVEPMAMAHRRRDPGTARSEGWSEAVRTAREQERDAGTPEVAAAGERAEGGEARSAMTMTEGAADGTEGGTRSDSTGPATEAAMEGAPGDFDGSLFAVRKIQLPRGRTRRRVTGKRRQAPSSDRRGRYVGSTQVEHPTDVAIDATLRSAAPHQRRRRQELGVDPERPAVHIEPADIRQKVRRRKTGTFIVFVVDASASMDAEQRMQATKGAVLSLLRDAYIRRDKVSLVVFSGRAARVALQPTSSVDLAESRLRRLSVGGTTPLTHGLAAGLRLIRTERLRDPGVYALLVLISDGRGNISLFGDEPLVEAQNLAARLAEEHVRVLVIDSARDHRRPAPLPRVRGRVPEPPPGQGGSSGGFNPCQDLAQRAGGDYLGLFDLSQGAIVDSVARTLRRR